LSILGKAIAWSIVGVGAYGLATGQIDLGSIKGASCIPPPGYSADQMTNAATIVAAGKQMHVPERGRVIAIAAAMQESELRNLNHGDRDSLGLFQQRPSQGWGTPDQITNPTYAATAFYRHLVGVPGWQQMSVNDAAQAVQKSGTPKAFGRHESAARSVAARVGGAGCASAIGIDQYRKQGV
jgi:hypothetical protein